MMYNVQRHRCCVCCLLQELLGASVGIEVGICSGQRDYATQLIESRLDTIILSLSELAG
jgi:hypothetical protein